MAAAERRRGRRENGLDATDWRAIEDLDPRVTEQVLDQLAARGIAAYAQPAVDVDPVTRSATLPSRPADRLYVDRRRSEAARDCVRDLLGGGTDPAGPGGGTPVDPPAGAGETGPDDGQAPGEAGATPEGGPGTGDQPSGADADADRPDRPTTGPAAPADVDATFAGIVADFERPVDPTAASWPAAEDVHPADRAGHGQPDPDPPAKPRSGPVDARDVTEPSLLDALDTFGTDLPDQEPPERFVPPTPPPLPRFSRQTVLGWIAIVVGLLLLIGRPDLLPLDRGTTMLLGFAGILGGAVALILRLRPGTEPDDHRPDDGAQV